MKKMIVIWMVAMMILPIFTGVTAMAAETKVYVHGQEVFFPDMKPTIVDGRTLVPLRAVFEKLGADVEWDQSTKTASITQRGNTLKIQINNDKMVLNNETLNQSLDVPAQLLNERTMIPLRFPAQALGYEVEWDGGKNTVYVTGDGLKKNEEGGETVASGFSSNDMVAPSGYLTLGEDFSVKGNIGSAYPIETLIIAVVAQEDWDDVKLQVVKNPMSEKVDLSVYNDVLEFNFLPNGAYMYIARVIDTMGESYVGVQSYFTVAEKSSLLNGKGFVYTYGGKEYIAIKGFEQYLYRQSTYEKMLGTSGMCTATSWAISTNINGKNIDPNFKEVSPVDNWGKGGRQYLKPFAIGEKNCSAEQKLKTAYEELEKGYAVWIRCDSKSGASGHDIVAVGFSVNADYNDLSTADFLIIDPADGKIKTGGSYKAKGTTGSSYRYVGY